MHGPTPASWMAWGVNPPPGKSVGAVAGVVADTAGVLAWMAQVAAATSQFPCGRGVGGQPVRGMRHVDLVATLAECRGVADPAGGGSRRPRRRVQPLRRIQSLPHGQPVGAIVRGRDQWKTGGMARVAFARGSRSCVLRMAAETLDHVGASDALLGVRRHQMTGVASRPLVQVEGVGKGGDECTALQGGAVEQRVAVPADREVA